jgi:archaellin
MAASKYPDEVAAYFDDRGWSTTVQQIRDGVYVVAGSQSSAETSEQMLTLVVTEQEDSIRTEHLRFLLKAGEDKNADSLFLTTTQQVTDKVREACDEHGISVIDSDTVIGTGDLLSSVEDISMPAGDQSSDTVDQGQESLTPTEENFGADADAATQSESPGMRASTDDTATQRGPRHPQQSSQPEAETTITRRKLLIAGVGITAVGGGGYLVVDGSLLSSGSSRGDGFLQSQSESTGQESTSQGDGFLQSQSESTGQESTSQVTNRLEVGPVTGTVNATDEITDVSLTVGKYPGSGDINIREVVVQWIGPESTFTLTEANSGTESDGTFAIEPIKDSNQSFPVLTDTDDRFRLRFELSKFRGENLTAGEAIELKLTTESSSETNVRLNVPDTLENEDTVSL